MDALDDVPAVREDPSNVLRVHSARKMRVALVLRVPHGNLLKHRTHVQVCIMSKGKQKMQCRSQLTAGKTPCYPDVKTSLALWTTFYRHLMLGHEQDCSVRPKWQSPIFNSTQTFASSWDLQLTQVWLMVIQLLHKDEFHNCVAFFSSFDKRPSPSLEAP